MLGRSDTGKEVGIMAPSLAKEGMEGHVWHLRSRLALRSALMAALLAVLLGGSLSGVAMAATPYCTYSGCNGKNPGPTNCASTTYGTKTLAEFTAHYDDGRNRFPIQRVELRYSPFCQALWVRAKNHAATYAGNAYIEHCNSSSCGKRYLAHGGSSWSDNTVWWSAMQSNGSWARACTTEWVKASYGGVKEKVTCTGWY